MTLAQCMLIPKATNTLSDYVILVALHSNNDGTNAPQCCSIRILAILLTITLFMRYDTVFIGILLVKFRKSLLHSDCRKRIAY